MERYGASLAHLYEGNSKEETEIITKDLSLKEEKTEVKIEEKQKGKKVNFDEK